MSHNPIVASCQAIQDKPSAILTTVIEFNGAFPAKVSAQIAYCADCATVCTANGGKLEAAILADGHKDTT